MSSARESLISKLRRKLGFPAPVETQPAPLQPLASSGERTGKTGKRNPKPLGIEMLEGRIAPASLINPSTLVYTDKDGDQVTVKFSKSLFTASSNESLTTLLNSVFKFSTGSVVAGGVADTSDPQELQLIDLTKLPVIGLGSKAKSVAAGVSFTVSSEQAAGGDGFANVGAINATSTLNSFGLGKVTIDGDLGQIDCGVPTSAVGLASLSVHSMGAVAGTQPSGTAGFPNTESKIIGTLGKLTVTTDVKNARINVVNGVSFGDLTSPAKIGSVTIGGSLQGNAAITSSSDNTGLIQSEGSIGSIKIGSGQTTDGIIGGGGTNSGSIIASGKIGSVLINGSILGNDGTNSGSILANGGFGKVKVTGDLKIAGAANAQSTAPQGASLSASIEAGGNTGSIEIGGSVQSGVGEGSGTIKVNGTLGSISINGSLEGNGLKTGGILVTGDLGSVTIGGDVKGGNGFFSGFIQGDANIGKIKIGQDLESGTGSTAERNAVIVAGESISSITIGGSVIGGAGISSGSINAGLSGSGTLAKLSIGGQVVGGIGESSASIVSGGKIGNISVTGKDGVALQGASGRFSAAIFSAGEIASIQLGGDIAGGNGNGSASVQSTGLLAKITVAGDLIGGLGNQSGSIVSHDFFDDGIAGDLGRISLAGKIFAGRGAQSGAIIADGNIASIQAVGMEVGTFVVGQPGQGTCAIVSGLGAVHAGDVGAISMSGNMDGNTPGHEFVQIHGSLRSLLAQGGITNGEIHVADKIGSIVTGKTGRNAVAGNLDHVEITAGSLLPSSAKQATVIAKITVNGSVSDSRILAGYDLDGIGTNADAQIGSVKVSGNWAASDLVAGATAENGFFGDADDKAITGGSADIVSRIASLTIGGTVSGTSGTDADHFGFVAQQIGTFKVAGSSSPTLPADVAVKLIA